MTRDSYKGAVMCEKSHLRAAAVKNYEYRLGAYPWRVTLLFPDGKERAYVIQD
jgi:hypothetical protein